MNDADPLFFPIAIEKGVTVAKRDDIPEQSVRIYTDALKVAYSDGSLSDDGELMLESLQNRFEIDKELHEELQMEVFAYLAELHKEKGEEDEALKWFQVLTDIDDDDEYAWRQMGIIYTERNDYQLAGRALKRAHQISERAKKDLKYAEKVEKKMEFYKRMQTDREETVKKRSEKGSRRRRKRREPEIVIEVPELIEDEEEGEVIEMEDSVFEFEDEDEAPPVEFDMEPPEEEPEMEVEMEEDEEEEEEEPEDDSRRRRRGGRRRRRARTPPPPHWPWKGRPAEPL